jgi:uncharacterized membrane protein YeaQ/YmgE (transglycosylase-associated protein family)
MSLIALLFLGIVIGVLGKFIAPSGKDNIPAWLTVVCGIAGVLVGTWIYHLLGGNGSPGIDWTRWLVATVVAAGFVVLASTLSSRRTRRARKWNWRGKKVRL